MPTVKMVRSSASQGSTVDAPHLWIVFAYDAANLRGEQLAK